MSRLLLVFAFAATAIAAPVPKVKAKIDPGKAWEFPDLESKGWVEQKNGLKVWDVKEGEGDEVVAGGTVTVKYVGWTTDGKKFDGGEDKPPITFGLRQVIKGWGEGVVGMKPGGVRRLSIPPELGYGKVGVRGQIPGDATLVFVIEYVGPGK